MSNDPTSLEDFYSYTGGANGIPVANQGVPESPAPDVSYPVPEPAASTDNDVHSAILGTHAFGQNSSPPTNTSSSSGMSVSTKGLDTRPGGAFDYAETKGKRGYQKDLAQAHNESSAMFNALNENATAAAQGKMSAIGQEADATANKYDANAELTGKLAEQEKQNAIEDQKDYALAQVKTQAYMADYEKSINELATMSVNPGRAYSQLSGNAQAGVKVTAFITDFLGAKGIKSSGMDYINRGIDLDIQAQRDEIALKKDVASGKQNLWQMQRQQSESDYEATVRTRGALLSAFKTEIQGKLASFDSPIARAKAAEATAEVDQELVKTRTTLAQIADNSYIQKAQTAAKVRGDSLQAGSAAAELTFRKSQAQEARDSAAAAAHNLDPKVTITDTEGNLLGLAHDETEARITRDRVEKIGAMQDKLKQYADLVAEVKSHYKGPGQRFFTTNDKAKLAVALRDLGYAYSIANNGARPTDKDYENSVKQFAEGGWTDSLLNDADSTKTTLAKLGQLNRFNDTTAQAFINSHIIPVTDPDALKNVKGGASAGSLQRYGDINLMMENLRNQPKPDVSAVTEARGNIEAEGGKNTGGGYVNSADKNDGQIYDDAVGFYGRPDRPQAGLTGGGAIKRGTVHYTNEFKNMADLASIARGGDDADFVKDDSGKLSRSEDYVKHRQDAVNQLVAMSKYTPGPLKNLAAENKAAEATYFLMSLGGSPVVKDLNVPDIKELDPAIVKAILDRQSK